jgi:beta-mannosidase
MDKLTFSPAFDGSVRVDLQIAINESLVINAWYPNGIGSQMLYKLKVILMTPQESFSKTLKIGFRTIELIQDTIKPDGLTFYFKVNGIPFFAKGSNWIPAHVFPELLTKDYIRNLLQSTKDANMNMLRVWGGGVYETNDFYEIADELGIMIWHDFMFACALYPTNDEFLASVETEILQQVRRLQHHPSIALWAGILSFAKIYINSFRSLLKLRLNLKKLSLIQTFLL